MTSTLRTITAVIRNVARDETATIKLSFAMGDVFFREEDTERRYCQVSSVIPKVSRKDAKVLKELNQGQGWPEDEECMLEFTEPEKSRPFPAVYLHIAVTIKGWENSGAAWLLLQEGFNASLCEVAYSDPEEDCDARQVICPNYEVESLKFEGFPPVAAPAAMPARSQSPEY